MFLLWVLLSVISMEFLGWAARKKGCICTAIYLMKGGQDLVKLAGESWKWEVGSSKKGDLGPVVQTLDSAIHH